MGRGRWSGGEARGIRRLLLFSEAVCLELDFEATAFTSRDEAEVETVDEPAVAALHVVGFSSRLNPFIAFDDVISHRRFMTFLTALAMARPMGRGTPRKWRSSPLLRVETMSFQRLVCARVEQLIHTLRRASVGFPGFVAFFLRSPPTFDLRGVRYLEVVALLRESGAAVSQLEDIISDAFWKS